MKAHIVGGGFAGLAAAALLIRNANVSGPDITIYEAEEKLGGGFFLDGDAEHGYNLPGSIFDKHFRCALDLLATIPTQGYPNINVAEQFLTFNQRASRSTTRRISSTATSAACMTHCATA